MAPANTEGKAAYQKDEKALCFHGELLYEAKILDTRRQDPKDKSSPFEYRVHYKGWKNTWDDWVPQDRLRKNTEENRELAVNLKKAAQEQNAPRSAKPSAAAKGRKGQASEIGSGRGSEVRDSSVPARGTKRARDNDIEKWKETVRLPDGSLRVVASGKFPLPKKKDATHDEARKEASKDKAASEAMKQAASAGATEETAPKALNFDWSNGGPPTHKWADVLGSFDGREAPPHKRHIKMQLPKQQRGSMKPLGNQDAVGVESSAVTGKRKAAEAAEARMVPPKKRKIAAEPTSGTKDQTISNPVRKKAREQLPEPDTKIALAEPTGRVTRKRQRDESDDRDGGPVKRAKTAEVEVQKGQAKASVKSARAQTPAAQANAGASAAENGTKGSKKRQQACRVCRRRKTRCSDECYAKNEGQPKQESQDQVQSENSLKVTFTTSDDLRTIRELLADAKKKRQNEVPQQVVSQPADTTSAEKVVQDYYMVGFMRVPARPSKNEKEGSLTSSSSSTTRPTVQIDVRPPAGVKIKPPPKKLQHKSQPHKPHPKFFLKRQLAPMIQRRQREFANNQ
ncbi:Esa1p-associated factor [Lithohypha guttulata]|uniref:Chromatin modification-related protein EAF3 n=1 Tax=Lithohypha guttulata TaxID=1690604 RepID=A0AAN7T0F5_9EURO|nr:Esa1p-associated factor [Lithohypha guttulata]